MARIISVSFREEDTELYQWLLSKPKNIRSDMCRQGLEKVKKAETTEEETIQEDRRQLGNLAVLYTQVASVLQRIERKISRIQITGQVDAVEFEEDIAAVAEIKDSLGLEF